MQHGWPARLLYSRCAGSSSIHDKNFLSCFQESRLSGQVGFYHVQANDHGSFSEKRPVTFTSWQRCISFKTFKSMTLETHGLCFGTFYSVHQLDRGTFRHHTFTAAATTSKFIRWKSMMEYTEDVIETNKPFYSSHTEYAETLFSEKSVRWIFDGFPHLLAKNIVNIKISLPSVLARNDAKIIASVTVTLCYLKNLFLTI